MSIESLSFSPLIASTVGSFRKRKKKWIHRLIVFITGWWSLHSTEDCCFVLLFSIEHLRIAFISDKGKRHGPSRATPPGYIHPNDKFFANGHTLDCPCSQPWKLKCEKGVNVWHFQNFGLSSLGQIPRSLLSHSSEGGKPLNKVRGWRENGRASTQFSSSAWQLERVSTPGIGCFHVNENFLLTFYLHSPCPSPSLAWLTPTRIWCNAFLISHWCQVSSD